MAQPNVTALTAEQQSLIDRSSREQNTALLWALQAHLGRWPTGEYFGAEVAKLLRCDHKRGMVVAEAAASLHLCNSEIELEEDLLQRVYAGEFKEQLA